MPVTHLRKWAWSWVWSCMLVQTSAALAGATNAVPSLTSGSFLKVQHGGTILLNCSLPRDTTYATWLEPRNGLPVSLNENITDASRQGAAHIIRSESSGQYNLLLKYANFPHDNGTWTCTDFHGHSSQVTMLVLKAPVSSQPLITPSSGAIELGTADAWMFTCVAQHAYPPVRLTWVQEHSATGDENVPFEIIPQTALRAPDQTLSSSIKLLLNARHVGSVFRCLAEHPTFRNAGHSAKVRILAASVPAHPSMHKAELVDHSVTSSPKSLRNLTVLEAWFLAATFMVGGIAVVVSVCLCQLTKHWQLDVRKRHRYSFRQLSKHSPTTAKKSCLLNGNVNNNSNTPSFTLQDQTEAETRERRRCIIKLVLGVIFSFNIMVVVVFMVPVYIATVSPPSIAADESVHVQAGTVLQLDCFNLSRPLASLIRINWNKDGATFYHQYKTNGYTDIPARTKLGMTMAWQTRSQITGQLVIAPILPGDDGIYECNVAHIMNDYGTSQIRKKTIAVFVVTGAPSSVGLMFMSILGTVNAICLITLLLYMSVRRRDTILNNYSPHMSESENGKKKPLDDTIYEVDESKLKMLETPV